MFWRCCFVSMLDFVFCYYFSLFFCTSCLPWMQCENKTDELMYLFYNRPQNPMYIHLYYRNGNKIVFAFFFGKTFNRQSFSFWNVFLFFSVVYCILHHLHFRLTLYFLFHYYIVFDMLYFPTLCWSKAFCCFKCCCCCCFFLLLVC